MRSSHELECELEHSRKEQSRVVYHTHKLTFTYDTPMANCDCKLVWDHTKQHTATDSCRADVIAQPSRPCVVIFCLCYKSIQGKSFCGDRNATIQACLCLDGCRLGRWWDFFIYNYNCFCSHVYGRTTFGQSLVQTQSRFTTTSP